MLFQLDDTIKHAEANMLFDDIDTDKSETISVEEFEKRFALEPGSLKSSDRLEKLAYAAPIFSQINQRLEENQ